MNLIFKAISHKKEYFFYSEHIYSRWGFQEGYWFCSWIGLTWFISAQKFKLSQNGNFHIFPFGRLTLKPKYYLQDDVTERIFIYLGTLVIEDIVTLRNLSNHKIFVDPMSVWKQCKNFVRPGIKLLCDIIALSVITPTCLKVLWRIFSFITIGHR